MRVLVTGHNGYIGSAMVPVLTTAGHALAGLDTFFFEGCTLTADVATVPAARLDVRNVDVEDLEGFDAVIHLAAVHHDPQGVRSAERVAEINHRGAVHVANCAREAGVGRFFYASSCSVYGAAAEDEAFGEDAAVRPATAGATAMARAEEAIVRLADAGFSPVIMRSATAYGVSPRLRADTVLNNLVCWAHATGRVRATDDGAPRWRPLIHVEDIARAFAAALAAPREVIHGQIFNVGSDGENYQLDELTEIVLAAVPGSVIEHGPVPSGQPSGYRVHFGKMSRALTDFRPRWNAAFGAKDLYAVLQDVGVTREDIEGRYSRVASLQRLLGAGRLDEHLRWRDALAAGAAR